jgi:hypothetical protein
MAVIDRRNLTSLIFSVSSPFVKPGAGPAGGMIQIHALKSWTSPEKCWYT